MWLVFCLTVLAITVEPKIFEFGHNSRFLIMVDSSSGNINAHEKSKTIDVQVPTCFDIKYIAVNVYNKFSTPSVKYNRRSNTVKIEYTPRQTSISTYDVTVRAKRRPVCSEYEIQKLWGGGGTCFIEIDYKTGKQTSGCSQAYGDKGGWGRLDGVGHGGGYRRSDREYVRCIVVHGAGCDHHVGTPMAGSGTAGECWRELGAGLGVRPGRTRPGESRPNHRPNQTTAKNQTDSATSAKMHRRKICVGGGPKQSIYAYCGFPEKK